jgi:predicted site-specific integrase-resolvase
VTAEELEVRLLAQGKFVSLDQCVMPDVAAEILGVSVGTLKNWRADGTGPPFICVARVRYPLQGIAEHREANTKK